MNSSNPSYGIAVIDQDGNIFTYTTWKELPLPNVEAAIKDAASRYLRRSWDSLKEAGYRVAPVELREVDPAQRAHTECVK